jgi:hypothetical protein
MGTSTGTDFNGVTMWVGSTPGASDIGEIRVKYLTGTSIGVPLNDGIPWTAGQYLTLTNFREIWPIYASYVPNANLSDIILSIDGTINYTNQNANMGAFNCMGCGYAGFIGDQISLNASGTMSVVDGRTISSYIWNCPGATPSAVTGSVGTISYPTAGFYVVRLTTVDSAGVPTISYRHFSIYDHQNNPPIGQWGLDSLASNTSDILKKEGGYSGEIWVRQILPNIDDGALVTIFAEEEDFGTDQRSIGGRIGREKIVFSGYVVGDTVSYDYKSSVTKFTVENVTDFIKRKEGLSVSIDDTNITPTEWQQIQGLNVKKAVWEYFTFYNTVGMLTDIRYIGWDGAVQFFQTSEGSIYDSLNNYLQNQIYGQLMGDRQSTIFIEPGIHIAYNATGTYPTTFNLSDQDWDKEPSIELTEVAPYSYVEIGGYVYSGTVSLPAIPVLSEAPGPIRGYAGKVEKGEQSLIVTDQNQLNVFCGELYANLNARFPKTTIDLSGNYRNLDICPNELVTLSLMSGDTHRQIVWTNKPFYIIGTSLSYSSVDALIRTQITLHEVVNSVENGITLPVPQTPDTNAATTPSIGNYNFPAFTLPFVAQYPKMNYPVPSLADCHLNLSAGPNGPFNVGLIGTVTSEDTYSLKAEYPCWIRGSNSTYPTNYILNGSWLSRTIGGTVGPWTSTLDDTFYQLYGLDYLGNRIAQAVKDAVIAPGNMRTGHFNISAGENIVYLELAMSITGSLATQTQSFAFGGTGTSFAAWSNGGGATFGGSPGITSPASLSAYMANNGSNLTIGPYPASGVGRSFVWRWLAPAGTMIPTTGTCVVSWNYDDDGGVGFCGIGALTMDGSSNYYWDFHYVGQAQNLDLVGLTRGGYTLIALAWNSTSGANAGTSNHTTLYSISITNVVQTSLLPVNEVVLNSTLLNNICQVVH